MRQLGTTETDGLIDENLPAHFRSTAKHIPENPAPIIITLFLCLAAAEALIFVFVEKAQVTSQCINCMEIRKDNKEQRMHGPEF